MSGFRLHAIVLAATLAGACGPPHRPARPSTAASTDPDGDRIAGAADLCPREPEVYNGVDDGDGCPDRPRGREDCVWIDVLEILDRLTFDPGSAVLPARTQPIVEAVAATIAGNPQIEQVAVVGGRAPGEPDALAAERAAAVTAALVARGIAGDRLVPHDHLAPVTDPTGRVVWFVVLRIDGADARPASGDARWAPWDPDCPAKWKAHRERGAAIDCACLDARPPE